VPVEIALKVAAKIRRGERFAVYVVTPMWPEGAPAGEAVQAILLWNRRTVEMMYGVVAKAIEDAGLRGQAHPCDYLNFFCLGNREAPLPGEYSPPETPEEDTDYWRAQVNRRGPIYVHAKLMIGTRSLQLSPALSPWTSVLAASSHCLVGDTLCAQWTTSMSWSARRT
jgi:phospholipase D1/2